ncbi:thioesterase [Streptomyces sp. TUS-ST3]|uniref:thioesterase II family protein n=1 Tax=Streptomyces sp. TUS-ST3 TaxID=3025591 RepID=UPI0024E102DD|nr:thioesterase domain-containing protein [Streptomyces sp. TUS-ST3]GLP63918.1 thioesterase [Streptomyces sp. TUS-ST3]
MPRPSLTATSDRVLSCPQPRPGATVRLVCFPHSGGGPATFRDWHRGAGAGTEVRTVVLPGRAARSDEPFADDWRSVVAETADAVRRLTEASDSPAHVVLFGQSLGALLAFETARELERAGIGPRRLVVSARSAPDIATSLDVPSGDAALLDLVDRRYGGIPTALRAVPELLAHQLPPLRADLRLAGSYRFAPGTPLTTPVIAFAGTEDSTVPPGELLGWARHTTGAFTPHLVPGGHLCSMEHPALLLRAALGHRVR